MLHLGLYSERDTKVMRIDHDDQEGQHNAIVKAFEAQDAEAVEKAMRAHIESSQSLVMKAMLNARVSFSL